MTDTQTKQSPEETAALAAMVPRLWVEIDKLKNEMASLKMKTSVGISINDSRWRELYRSLEDEFRDDDHLDEYA